MTTIMYVSAILAVVIILTIIGVLSRYRRCKPNYDIFNMDFGQDLEPEELTKHYDQCYGIDFETEEEEDEEYDR